MTLFARVLKISSDGYETLSSKAKEGFHRFWNVERQCCYDVIDAPGIGNDASLRPNQIFAVSLPVSPLPREQQKSVVDICAAQLLTPYVLRSLAPGESGYHGLYGCGPRDRFPPSHPHTASTMPITPPTLTHLHHSPPTT